jgi:hypothetical protein
VSEVRAHVEHDPLRNVTRVHLGQYLSDGRMVVFTSDGIIGHTIEEGVAVPPDLGCLWEFHNSVTPTVPQILQALFAEASRIWPDQFPTVRPSALAAAEARAEVLTDALDHERVRVDRILEMIFTSDITIRSDVVEER